MEEGLGAVLSAGVDRGRGWVCRLITLGRGKRKKDMAITNGGCWLQRTGVLPVHALYEV